MQQAAVASERAAVLRPGRGSGTHARCPKHAARVRGRRRRRRRWGTGTDRPSVAPGEAPHPAHTNAQARGLARSRRRPLPAALSAAGHRPAATPVRPLSSLIISSQAPSLARSPVQNDCCGGLTNSLERDALLLDPGVVAQVENPVPVLARRLEQAGGVGRQHPAGEHLGGVRLVETAREVAGRDPLPLALVHLGAVGGDGHDYVIGTEPEMFGRLHGGEDVADAGEAERRQGGERLVRHAAAVSKIGDARPAWRTTRPVDRWPDR